MLRVGCGVGWGFLGGWRVGRRGLSNVKDLMECGKRLKQDARGGNCVQRDHGIDRPIVAGSRMWIYQTPQPMWLSTEGLKWKWLNVSVNLFEAIGVLWSLSPVEWNGFCTGAQDISANARLSCTHEVSCSIQGADKPGLARSQVETKE